MAFLRDKMGQPIKGADGQYKTIVTEAQARASELYQQRKQERQEALVKRQEERAKRTPQQQLDFLDERLGKGQGARKERARLLKQILEAQA